MKLLNVDPKVFDSADSTIWRSNPFYREPPYQLSKEDVKFKRLCENSMTFIADSCYQSCLLYARAVDSLDEVDKCMVAVLSEIYAIAGDRGGDSEFVEGFEVVIKTVDECFSVDGVSVVVVPVASFGSARERCCDCGFYRHDIVLWHNNGHFFVNIVCDHAGLKYTGKSSNRASFFNYLQTNLENLVTELKWSSSDLSDFDVLDLKTDFNHLFQDLDTQLHFGQEDPTDVKTCSLSNHSCVKMCEKLSEHLNIVVSHCDCKGGSNSIDACSKYVEAEFNKKYTLMTRDLNSNNHNAFGGEIKKFTKYENLPPADLKCNFDQDLQDTSKLNVIGNKETYSESVSIVHNKLSDLDLEQPVRKTNGAEYVESRLGSRFIGQKLPVLQEESYDILAYAKKLYRGRTSSESSDVAEWRRDLWLNALDEWDDPELTLSAESAEQWFSSTDNEGRVYFFEENSNKSSWTLPDSSSIISHENKVADGEQSGSVTSSPVTEKYQSRSSKSKSMILGTRLEESTSSSNFSMQWPQLLGGTMCILKEGPLNRTKITENGKRVRKNWTSTYAVLTELLLLFFKDNKGFSSMMSGKGGPELSVDLNGAVIDGGDKVSSRKNVYMLSTVLGLQVLIQSDCATSAEQWLAAVRAVINNLPSSIEGKGPRTKPESPVEESKPVIRIGRSKSMKLKNKSASIEDLSNVAERQTKIKEKLKKFFNRRPTRELLVRKGIYKDEPVFGGLLEHTCPTEPPRVPLFVHHCVQCVERSEDNMKTDGLYRVSGNLSQVQKIRLQVDQNTYTLLEQEEDVHVLAGTLKLFFRELRQPLIPYKFFDKALRASTNSNYNEKIKDFRDIVKSLPSCNHDTLKFLLQHLLRVTQYQEFNRMHIPNIAIVFGPTLMWPEQESQNMAFDMMQQNLVIECFLSEFHNIFR